MKAYITLAGERLHLVPPHEMSFDESLDAARLSGGMGIGSLEAGLQDGHPLAWYAIAYVSMRRRDPNTTETLAKEAMKAQPLVDVWKSIEREDDPLPPASAPASDVVTPASDAPEAPASETTPEVSGSPV